MKTLESWQLKQRQKLPLKIKEKITKQRIESWYEYWNGNVYIGFSGGKDSTVLLHIVRKMYPNVPAVFSDTGLEYPEIRAFVKTFDNVTWIKPKISYRKVIEEYGYPVLSKENAQKIWEIRNTNSEKLRNKRLYGDRKGHGRLPKKWKVLLDLDIKISHKCCDMIKKNPVKRYETKTKNKAILGLMAKDNVMRRSSYLRFGCNSYSNERGQHPTSSPIAFWLEQDVWSYIKKYNVSYSKIYDMGYNRTGCMFCMFGVHLEKGENRFQRMKRTHPKHWDYCINKLGCGKVMDFIKVNYGQKENKQMYLF